MCYKKTFYVDVNAFLPQNLMILKADISKTSTGRYLFLFIFICGNSKCTRIQKIKNFSGEVNWVPLALRAEKIFKRKSVGQTVQFRIINSPSDPE